MKTLFLLLVCSVILLPQTADDPVAKADTLIAKGKFSAAIKVLQPVLEKDKYNEAAILRLLKLYLEKNRGKGERLLSFSFANYNIIKFRDERKFYYIASLYSKDKNEGKRLEYLQKAAALPDISGDTDLNEDLSSIYKPRYDKALREHNYKTALELLEELEKYEKEGEYEIEKNALRFAAGQSDMKLIYYNSKYINYIFDDVIYMFDPGEIEKEGDLVKVPVLCYMVKGEYKGKTIETVNEFDFKNKRIRFYEIKNENKEGIPGKWENVEGFTYFLFDYFKEYLKIK